MTIANISECSEIARKNYSNSDYLCVKNPGQPIAGALGNPCLAGCPLVSDDKLVGMVTAGHRRLAKNSMVLAITKKNLLPFIQAVKNNVDLEDLENIEEAVEEFVKNIVDKSAFF